VKNLFIATLIFASSLQAISLNEIVDISLAKSPSLESINARLEANKQNIDIANQFSNPEILLTKNSIDSSQAMSQTTLTLKQEIPYYSKLDKKQDVAIAEDKLLEEKLRKAKVDLVERIKNEAYTIWELRELREIIDEYIILTKRNINLYESYTSVSDNQHMGIMKAELSLSELKIQKTSIDSQIDSAYARLSYLASFEVNNLDIDLKIQYKPELQKLKEFLKNNPDIALKDKEILKQNAKLNLADINNYPDFNLILGYAYRENFDNYLNFGVGISLPIYGTEDSKEEEVRAILLSKRSEKSDVEILIESKLKSYYAQMLSAYNIYHIIQDEALPQVAHMFDLSSSSISTGSDLFKYIDVLFQKLSLEQKSITAVANYKKAEAKILQLAGEMK
jgi:outer membrane protein TolC